MAINKKAMVMGETATNKKAMEMEEMETSEKTMEMGEMETSEKAMAMEEMETNEKAMVMEETVVKMVTQRRMEMEKPKVNQVMEIQAAMSSMLYDEIFLVSQEKIILYMAKVYFVN